MVVVGQWHALTYLFWRLCSQYSTANVALFFLKPPLAKQAPLDPHVGWDTRPFVLQLLTLAPQMKSSSVLIVPGFLLLDETLFAINGSRNIRRPAWILKALLLGQVLFPSLEFYWYLMVRPRRNHDKAPFFHIFANLFVDSLGSHKESRLCIISFINCILLVQKLTKPCFSSLCETGVIVTKR